MISDGEERNWPMRAACRSRPRGARFRRGAAAFEMAIIMPLFLLLILGCMDFGRFAYTLISITNAARAGAGVGIMSHYPNPDPATSTGLTNWQMSICTAVANELGMDNDFTPAGTGDANGYTQFSRTVCPGHLPE